MTIKIEQVPAVGGFFRLEATVVRHLDGLAAVGRDPPDVGNHSGACRREIDPAPVSRPRRNSVRGGFWGVKDTARHFHDNGAKTLRDAVGHYQRFFKSPAEDPVGSLTLSGFFVLTDDDVDDIVAYSQLLGPNARDR
jgi:hypothetical protein